MAKKPENITDDENIGDVPQAPLIIHKQYLKDMSFESPNSPEMLKPATNRPEMDMNIMLDIQKLKHPKHEYFYEVTLTLTTSAKREGKTLFLAEIIYGATASIQGLEEKQHHPILFIEVPQLMFPFARQIMAHATQSGGFTALHLSPVDFRAMYLKRFAEQRAQNKEQKEA